MEKLTDSIKPSLNGLIIKVDESPTFSPIVSIRPEINHSTTAGSYLWGVITGSDVIYVARRSPSDVPPSCG